MTLRSLKFRPTRSRRNQFGFSLIELLVVMGIIVAIIAVMIPTVNTLTGNRSLAAGQNRFSSTLSVARQFAINEGKPVGLAIYPDPTDGGIRLAFIEQTKVNSSGRSQFDIIAGSEIVQMPKGVGAQVQTATAASGSDQFLALGLIVFDSHGNLATDPVDVAPPVTGSSTPSLGADFQLIPGAAPTTPVEFPVGVATVVYDATSFASQGFKPGDYYLFGTSTLESTYSSIAGSTSTTDETTKEQWLIDNGQFSMINQTSGSLVEAK